MTPLFRRSVLLASLACLGALGLACDRADETGRGEAPLGAVRESAVRRTGTGNDFTVLWRVGDAVGQGAGSSTFSRRLDLGAAYVDRAGYYGGRPEHLFVVMNLRTHRVIHGSLDQPSRVDTHAFEIQRQADGTYRGMTNEAILLPGHFGGDDTIVDGVDVAFRGAETNGTPTSVGTTRSTCRVEPAQPLHAAEALRLRAEDTDERSPFTRWPGCRAPTRLAARGSTSGA